MAISVQRLPWRPPSTRHPSGVGAQPVYRPRHPAASALYAVVQHHIETFLAHAAESDPVGYGLPTWVEKDFRVYLRCGILAYGFARARCDACGHERLIAFSCKGRGICPSCNARRMAELAAHLTDHVLPHLPVRQWVLSVPKRLRPYARAAPEVAGAVLGIFLRAIRTTLRRTSPGATPDAQLGAVSFLHRFGSSLNPHFHFHLVVLDGVFEQAHDGTVRFHEATRLTSDDWLDLQRLVQRRVLRHFRTRGLLEEHDAVGMLTWQGSGGFSIDASVHIQGDDRGGLERLIRYCARPPFALERLHALAGIPSLASPQARLLYRFARPTPDGHTEIVLSPLQLLERLAAFVPPPRVHRHRYHGVLAPHATLRAAVVAIGRPESAPPVVPLPKTPAAPDQSPRRASPARIRWAVLLARVYEVLPLLCSACGAEMRILAFLTDPPVVSAILLHLDLPHRPPPITPARGPPQADFLFDQTPAFDPLGAEPAPDLDFDQSLPPGLDD